MSGVTVLVPTVNEAGNIDELLDRIHAALPCEVIVIDGESTDGTQQRVRERGDARLVEQKGRKGGLTGAVLLGARAAATDVVVVIDADLSHPPEVIPELVARLDDHDMVIGSRKVPGGGAPEWPWVRKFVSGVASALAWPLTDARDPMAGFFATRRDLLLSVDPEAGGFKVGLEVLMLRDGTLRVDEVPITFRDRTGGESKLGSRVIRAYLERLFALAGGHALPAWAALGAVVDFAVMLALGDLAGGAVAWTLVYLLSRRHRLDDGMSEGRRAFRAITVGFMALFLRGGVYAWAGPAAAAITGGLLVHIGNVLYVFPRPQPPGAIRVRWRVAAMGIVLFSVLLRLAYAGVVDPMPEEAYYWNYAQHPATGYLDHPPMVAWLVWLGTAIFGDNPFGVRFFAVACWGVAAFYAYRLTRELYGKPTGILALGLMSSLPFFLGAGFLMTPDAPLIACWAAALYFLAGVFVGGRARAWWGAGAAIGLGMLAKYSILFLGPPILLLMLVDRRWWRRPEPYGAGVLALLLLSPVVLWNARHDWASFAFQSTRRIADMVEFSAHIQVAAALVMLTPIGVRALLSFREPSSARRRFLTAMVVLPFALVLLFSLRKWTKPNWTGPIWIAAVPILAGSIWRSATWSRRWGATISVVFCLLGGILHYFAVEPPGAWYPDRLRTPAGWRELSAAVSELEEGFASPPVVVGLDRYFIASELRFFDPDREVTGRHVVGQPGLMFEFWDDPRNFSGRDMLLIGLETYEFDALEPYFESLGPVQERRLGNKGRFYFRIARGYRPPR